MRDGWCRGIVLALVAWLLAGCSPQSEPEYPSAPPMERYAGGAPSPSPASADSSDDEGDYDEHAEEDAPPMAAAPMAAPGAYGPAPVSRTVAPAPAQQPQAPPQAQPQPGAGAAKQPSPDESPKAVSSRMLIFTANLGVRVEQESFSKTIDAAADAAIAMGGYVARQDERSITVRVPSGRFRDALKEMEKLGEVMQRSVQAQDVGEEYNDLDIRLKSLRATRDRLQEFLDRAKSIEEVLRVEQELSRLNGEIDRIEGRMRYLASQVSFSTITVSLEAKPKNAVIVDPIKPPPPPARTVPLPIEWLQSVGLDRLMQLQSYED